MKNSRWFSTSIWRLAHFVQLDVGRHDMKDRHLNCPLRALIESALPPELQEIGDLGGETRDPIVVNLGHSDCVTINLFATISGLTPAAVRGMIHEGKWLEGRQYFRRGGRVYISVKGYERWVQTGLA